jgi:hypothetical protein
MVRERSPSNLIKSRTRQPIGYATESKVLGYGFNTIPYSSSSFTQTVGGGACGMCDAAYLIPVVMLLPAPVGANGGTMLA